MSALSPAQEQEHHIPSSPSKHSFTTSDSMKSSDEIVVYSIHEHKISYRSRTELTKDDGEPVEGVQTTDIPMFKREVDIYLKGSSKGEATIFYTVVRLPSKVFKHRLHGDYKKLYVCT